MRHHAEGTELVAAGLGADEGLEWRGPHRRIPVGIVALKGAGDHLAGGPLAIETHLQPRPAPGEHLRHERRHLMQLPWPDHEIDPGGPLADEFLVFLGHAAEHAHHEVGLLLLLKPDAAEGRVDLVFGMLPHGAGVVEDGVGLARPAGHLPTLPAERRHHELAIEHVHLAANRFDPESLGHASHCSPPGDVGHRLGGGKSRVAGEDTPHAPRAFADPRAYSVNAGAWSLGSTQLHRLGSGKSRVAGEDTPHAPRAFADPRASSVNAGAWSLGSTQLHRLGGGKSRVAGG